MIIVNHKLLTACSIVLLAAGCATQSQVASKSHEESSVCEMPEVQGKVAATPSTQPAKPAKAFATFGGDQKLSDAQAVPVAAVLAAPDQYAGKYVRLTGVV